MKQILVPVQKEKTADRTISLRELAAKHSTKISSSNALALVTVGNETHALHLNEMVPTNAQLLLDENEHVIELQPMQGG